MINSNSLLREVSALLNALRHIVKTDVQETIEATMESIVFNKTNHSVEYKRQLYGRLIEIKAAIEGDSPSDLTQDKIKWISKAVSVVETDLLKTEEEQIKRNSTLNIMQILQADFSYVQPSAPPLTENERKEWFAVSSNESIEIADYAENNIPLTPSF